jgi:hypothetical protein
MRTYHHTTFKLLNGYDILYGGQKSDAGFCAWRRRRFLDSYGFCFSSTLLNVFVTEMWDSVVFGSTDGPLKFQRVLRIWLYAYLPSSSLQEIFLYIIFFEVEFWKVWVGLGEVRLG